MESAGTSLIKFLGYKRKNKMHLIEESPKKKECISLSEDSTQHTFSSIENDMEIDIVDGYSPLVQLENGDYSLDYAKIPRNNIFIIPDYLKVKEGSDIFKGWKYIDFIKYFRDQCYSGYYD